MDNKNYQTLLKEYRAKIELMDERKAKLIKEARVPVGFKKFFVDRLKKTGDSGTATEIKNQAKEGYDNMKYDMGNGDSMMTAFEKACRDLYIEQDGIENFL